MKHEWDERYVSVKYCPAHMNRVLNKMWRRVKVRAAPVIKKSFEITKLLPLLPPNEEEFAEYASIASVECGTGKKSIELKIGKDRVFHTPTTHITTNDQVKIITAQNDSQRNILIRTTAYDIVSKTFVAPVQELLDISNEIAAAKKVKLDTNKAVLQSRANPDSSSGLFVTSALQAQAQRVDVNRRKEKERKEEKRKENNIVNQERLLKRRES